MGNMLSYFGNSYGKMNDPDSITGLTSKEKYYIINSWAEIRKDTNKHGICVFMKYFDRHPEYLNYFSFRDVPLNQLCNNKKLQAHGNNVMDAITAIIDNINNKEILEDLLLKNGESHAPRKIPEKSYWNLKLVIIEVIKESLGTKWNKDIHNSWDKLLDVAFKIIIAGLKGQK